MTALLRETSTEPCSSSTRKREIRAPKTSPKSACVASWTAM